MNTEIENNNIEELLPDFPIEKTGDTELPEENVTKERETAFSQEQVNGIVAKETAKAIEKTLYELGFRGDGKAKEQLLQFKAQLSAENEQLQELAQQVTTLQNSLNETQALLLQAQLKSMLAFSGISEDKADTAAKLATALIKADFTVEEAVGEVVSKYPHLLAQGQTLPVFSAPTSEVSDKFSGIKSIFRNNVR